MSTAEVSTDNWIEVGPLDSIERRSARRVKTPHGDIAIFRTSSDEVFALRDSCPHQGGPLSQGIVSGTGVICPLHNWCIEMTTGEARDPDEGQTPRFPVRVEDGVIHLSLKPEV
jgi:nitrite reductase (NADH) small subunit